MDTSKKESVREGGRFKGPWLEELCAILLERYIHLSLQIPSGKFSGQLWLSLEVCRIQILFSQTILGPHFMLNTVHGAGDSEVNIIDTVPVPVKAADTE